ncbi:hypothetical protein POM88_001851 [Heracleum sosnowskyi]|uniref:MORN repeat-containing protein n=1 Tax=Heracleum sosnowskyi TaxID=360622 RepID=A0AAD8JEI4_9APIA|nr:hypothetical protein POM88_001851 [Heracleum sosnowskyi]
MLRILKISVSSVIIKSIKGSFALSSTFIDSNKSVNDWKKVLWPSGASFEANGSNDEQDKFYMAGGEHPALSGDEIQTQAEDSGSIAYERDFDQRKDFKYLQTLDTCGGSSTSFDIFSIPIIFLSESWNVFVVTANIVQSDSYKSQCRSKIKKCDIASIFTIMEGIRRGEEKFTWRGMVVLPLGEVYEGDFREMLPHGRGKCTHPDGTVYEGEWNHGNMSGKGKISGPTGAVYEGDFFCGSRDGIGTFTEPDGSVYKGSWKMNTRHGTGEMKYPNSEVYEGSWKADMFEGSGTYVWSNGITYIGTWKAGEMCGRGVLINLVKKWNNEVGFGRYKYGNYYFGTWTDGITDWRGKLYRASSTHSSLARWGSFESHTDKGEVPVPISLEKCFIRSHYVASCNASCPSSSCNSDDVQIELLNDCS